MKKKYYLFITIFVLFGINISLVSGSPEPSSTNYGYVQTNVSLSLGSYSGASVTVSFSGSDYVFYVQTSRSTEGVEIFICDSENYQKFCDDQTFSAYQHQENLHVGYKEFTIPYADTWHFVVHNKDELLGVTVDYFVDYDSSEIPYFSSTIHDYVKNSQIIEKGQYWTIYSSFTSGDIISGRFENYFSSDGIKRFFICDSANYQKFTENKDATVYGLKEDMSKYSIPSFTVPSTDTWYIVFDNQLATDTVTISVYLDYTLSYHLTDDVYENNDDASNAIQIDEGTHNNLVAMDDDWYWVFVGNDKTLSLTINFDHSDLDLDLKLYSDGGTTLLKSSTGYTDSESITYDVEDSGYFYIKVYSKSIGQTTYDLIIDIDDITNSDDGTNDDGSGGDNDVNLTHNNPDNSYLYTYLLIGGVVATGGITGAVIVKKRRSSSFDW